MPGVVTVACKLPNGIVLQLQEEYARDENVMGAIKPVKYHRFGGKKVVLKGAAFPADRGPIGTTIAGGFALTHGVDADFFEKWMKQNADNDAVQKGLVFAAAKPAEAESQAKEFKDELSGFEPVNPSKMPAEFAKRIATAEVA